MSSVLCFLFFFFQAEDGIRDTSVTGVQTCALPIYTSELAKNPSPPADQAVAAPATSGSVEQRLSSLEDTTQLLNSRVDDQYQTKVASASKYRVRLSGIALLNTFSNRGVTDNQDIPSW